MKKVKVTLIKSLNSASETQKRTAYAIGLKKLGQSREFKNTEAFKGQVNKIRHLTKLEGV